MNGDAIRVPRWVILALVALIPSTGVLCVSAVQVRDSVQELRAKQHAYDTHLGDPQIHHARMGEFQEFKTTTEKRIDLLGKELLDHIKHHPGERP